MKLVWIYYIFLINLYLLHSLENEWEDPIRRSVFELLFPDLSSLNSTTITNITLSHHCHWSGVECDSTLKVSTLFLKYENNSKYIFNEGTSFEVFPDLKILYVVGNFSGLIKGLPKLKKVRTLFLSFAENKVELPQDVFNEMKKLENFTLECWVDIFPDSLFGIKRLKYLTLRLKKQQLEIGDLGLTAKINDGLQGMSQLLKLELLLPIFVSQNFSFYSKNIEDFSLETWFISSKGVDNNQLILANTLEQIPGHCSTLKKFSISFVEMSSELIQSLFSCNSLQLISLVGVGPSFNEIPSSFSSLSNLKSLTLESNLSLKEIPSSINSLVDLKYLRIWNGQIDKFPNSLTLSNLETLELNFSQNRVTTINLQLSQNMKFLKVNGKFVKLEGLKNLFSLREFYGENIDRVPDLPISLQKLVLIGNISEWPQDFNSFKNLTYFSYTSTTSESEFPNIMFESSSLFPRLTVFLMKGPFKAQKLPRSFESFPNLMALQILGPGLESDQWFSNISSKLSFLYLSNINFFGNSVPISLIDYPNLQYILFFNLSLDPILPNQLSELDIELCFLSNFPFFECQSFYKSSICNFTCSLYFDSGVWYSLPQQQQQQQQKQRQQQQMKETLSSNYPHPYNTDWVIEESYLSLTRLSNNEESEMAYFYTVSSKVNPNQRVIVKYFRNVKLIEIERISRNEIMFNINNSSSSFGVAFMIDPKSQELVELCGNPSPNKWFNLGVPSKCRVILNKLIPSQNQKCLSVEGILERQTNEMKFKDLFLLSPSNLCPEDIHFESESRKLKKIEIETKNITNDFVFSFIKMSSCDNLKDPNDCCGDGLTILTESCDDGNILTSDGCNNQCEIENGWICENNNGDQYNQPSHCQYVCPDSQFIVSYPELCDNIGQNQNGSSSSNQMITIIGVIGGIVIFGILVLIGVLLKKMRDDKESYLIEENQIQFDKVLGEGNYGQVWKGVWKGTTEVAIKVVKVLNSSKVEKKEKEIEKALEEFKEEAKLYMKLPPHPNIVQLLGVVLRPQKHLNSSKIRITNSLNSIYLENRHSSNLERENNNSSSFNQNNNNNNNDNNNNQNNNEREEKIMIVLEYLPSGNMVQWMNRISSEMLNFNDDEKLKLQVELGKGISAGLHHLHSFGIIHRDLAARNVLIQVGFSENQPQRRRSTRQDNGGRARKNTVTMIKGGEMKVIAKLSDFGLSTSIKGRKVVPIRWASPEVLMNAENTSQKSDVWSFGIVMIEICNSCRNIPYFSYSLNEVMEFVLGGNIITIEENTHPRIKSLVSNCLSYDPEFRPTFSQIFKMLEGFQDQIQKVDSTMSVSQFNNINVVNEREEDVNRVSCSTTAVEYMNINKGNDSI